jgi:hypothetical protein
MGAFVGILLTRLAITSLSADLDSGEAFPNPYLFLVCWPLILVPFLPLGIPRYAVWSVMGLANAGTFALLFLIPGTIISTFFSRNSVKTAGGTQ